MATSNNQYLSPTIQVVNNEQIKETFKNRIEETTIPQDREYYARAREHFRAGKLNDVEVDCTNAILRNERFTEAWFLQGKVYAKKEKHDLAIDNRRVFDPLTHFNWIWLAGFSCECFFRLGVLLKEIPRP